MTKKERHKIYKKALFYFNTSENKTGICRLMFFATRYRYSIVKNFPELTLFRPDKICNHGYWFKEQGLVAKKSIREHRKTILEFCIEMTN